MYETKDLEAWCQQLPANHQARKQLKELIHHRDSTVGLFATDRPDLLSDEEKTKCHMFEIR